MSRFRKYFIVKDDPARNNPTLIPITVFRTADTLMHPSQFILFTGYLYEIHHLPT